MISAKELKELESLERQLKPIAGKRGGGPETCAKYLREVRRLRLRRPFQVAEYGMALINSTDERSKLGDEVWDVMEQVAIAAMDCQQLGIAKECIGALMIAFPNSTRVGRLEGMWLEAKGWWDQADKVYSDLLESNPQDQQVLKRQVAVLKGKGNTVGAISALKKYLETYMADYEAWKELGDLYISLHMFKQAAFCYEELLLSAPVNPIYHVTYAEILYSIGGAENYRQAISHYAAATEYSGGTNLRALYGTCMSFEYSGGTNLRALYGTCMGLLCTCAWLQASAALRSAGKPSRGAAVVEGEPEAGALVSNPMPTSYMLSPNVVHVTREIHHEGGSSGGGRTRGRGRWPCFQPYANFLHALPSVVHVVQASAALRSAGKPSRGAAAVEGEPEGLVEATAEAIKQEYRFKRPELLKPVVEPTLAKLVL
ncbi:unnamed protein product [Closterium sp. NIES-64]|nr:unnamed protein product [Closterium sp. NIES-64]